jgi:hypothetical protein
MFTIRLVTEQFAPNQTVTLRWGPNWDLERGGVFVDGAWTFDLDEAAFPVGIEFKFVLSPGHWMVGGNLFLAPADLAGIHDFADRVNDQWIFPPLAELTTENSVVAQRFFARNLSPDHVYDVIVVGSGMGGGILASRLAAANADVLVLEAGSYLFPTHVGNLPRRLKVGQFDKHIWSLWPDFKVQAYQNTAGSIYAGGQGFNLGGRSIFWGGLIPRQAPWELAAWPAPVRDYLLADGFAKAEDAMSSVRPDPDPYQASSRAMVQAAMPGLVAEDARVAVQYEGATELAIGAGVFSTADLLLQDRLLDAPGHVLPTVNLNFAVWRVDKDPVNPARVVGVTGWDLLGRRERSFKARKVVLSAGTIESAKIALQSGLVDPGGKIGTGITDHTIRFRHFTLPPGPPASATQSAKVLLRNPAASLTDHPYDVVVELGADFNQGRFIDPVHLALERDARAGWMLCELVFMHYSDLQDNHQVAVTGNPADDVQVTMFASLPSAAVLAETAALAAQFFADVGAQPVLGENGLGLDTALVGGVAHEVGTLRMAADGTGVVDADLTFVAYDNLFACDNSVFPASPAANPSLTTAALALRLAAHLT